MNNRQRAHFEQFLVAERTRIIAMLGGDCTVAGDAPSDRGRLGDDATSSANGASHDDDRAVSMHAARELASVDDALQLLRESPAAYGVCVTCTRPIPMERLRLVPGTRYCHRHARDA